MAPKLGSARKRAGSAVAPLGDDSLGAGAGLRVDTGTAVPAPYSQHRLIANKSGMPAALAAEGSSPTGYVPLYTPTHEYFAGHFDEAKRRAPAWVWWWMLVASCVVSIDSLYVLAIHYGARERIPAVVAQLWGMYGETDLQYAASGAGIRASRGWMPTQSQFNLLEVALQLNFMRLDAARDPAALSLALAASVATLWKTLIYMALIANAPKPLKLMPALKCFEAGAFSAPGSTCIADLIKFHFNFYCEFAAPACQLSLCARHSSALCTRHSSACRATSCARLTISLAPLVHFYFVTSSQGSSSRCS